MSAREIYQGDTGPLWRVGFTDNRSLTGYTCYVAIRGTSVYRQITATDANKFLVQLTPQETGGLAVGTHTVGIELRNPSASPPFIKEVHVPLSVKQQAVV